MEVNNSNSSNLNTSKLYLEDSYLFELKGSKLIAVEDYPKESNFYAMIFDKTIFHPQGGGQPSDEGYLENQSKKIIVNLSTISYDRERDLVLHKISKEEFSKSDIQLYDEFDMKINEEKRRLFARLHSAGHLLDISVNKIGLNLVPGKGYHFQDGPYVEYSGSLDKAKIPSLVAEIEKNSNEIISQSTLENSSISKFYDYEDGKKEFGTIPSYLPENKPFRWVKLLKEDLGCPCGGTHVKHVKDIQSIKINKITNKGKVVRVSYNVI
jgi:Ser-tRNA(Ala) deacylase AlaX